MRKSIMLACLVCSVHCAAWAKEPLEPPTWAVFGRVADSEGKGMAGAVVRASCGWGSLMPTGRTTTDDDGNYRLTFGPGRVARDRSGKLELKRIGVQAAVITAEKDGLFEKNLSRQGDLLMAGELPDPRAHDRFKPERIILPNKPRRIDFVMLRTAGVEVQVVDSRDQPLKKAQITINGKDMPPAASVLAPPFKTDEHGRFRYAGIPANYTWRFNLGEDLYADVPILSSSWHKIKLRQTSHPTKGYRTLQIVSCTGPDGKPRPTPAISSGPPWVSRHGMQCRMYAEKVGWSDGETPVLLAEVRNISKPDPRIPAIQELWQLEVDGVKHRWQDKTEAKYANVPPGETISNIRFTLGTSWRRPDGKPISLTPGTHSIRISTRYRYANGSSWIGSNWVNIEINR